MDTETKIFLEKIKTDIEFRNEFINMLNYWHLHYGRVERNRIHYIMFTPIWKQFWHKIRGKKPYENLNYESIV